MFRHGFSSGPRRRFVLGAAFEGLTWGIAETDLQRIRGFIDDAIGELRTQAAQVWTERNAIDTMGPAAMPDLYLFSREELLSQVLFDASELRSNLYALDTAVSRDYADADQKAALDAIERDLLNIEGSVPLGAEKPITLEHKDRSNSHRDNHTRKVGEIAVEAHRTVAEAQGAVGVPIGVNLPNEEPPRQPGQTVAEEPGFPWWILLVAGGILAVS